MSVENGQWRPDVPFVSDVGLMITMGKAVNLTPPGVLDVPLRFPVPVTDDLTIPYRFSWATQDTVNAGQFSRKSGAQLMEINLNTLLMDRIAAEASQGIVVWDAIHDPENFIRELRWISGTDDDRQGPACPFRLVISQPQVWNEPTINMVASLSGVDETMPANELATKRVSLTFLEFQEPEGQRAARGGSAGPGAPGSHTEKLTGSLYTLSIKYLGSASRWREIANANGIKNAQPNSALWLTSWGKGNHKTTLVIPPR